MTEQATRPLRLGEAFNHRGDRPTYWPGRLERRGDEEVAVPLKWQGSGDLRALADADGLLCFAAGDRRYEPGESTTPLFGGNSNWRGPIWFPPNLLLVEALQRFHYYLGDDFTVECPTGSGRQMNLSQVAAELSRRLTRPFMKDADGRRPVHGSDTRFQNDPHWRDLVLFYEYFHGDNGRGVGASHQTGWTGLVAKLLQQSGEQPEKARTDESDLEIEIA